MTEIPHGTDWTKNEAGIFVPPGTQQAPVVRAEFDVKVAGFTGSR